VSFQFVDSLTVFVETNAGEEVTSMQRLKLFGFDIKGTDVSELSKSGGC
jgi:hypothetical protein